ncbi:MAG: hypothetical protein II164_04800 [Firmicutes bacterium]|nr:hypothetical protein [Bacillota bacterium]
MRRHLRFFRAAAAVFTALLIIVSALVPAFASDEKALWDSEANSKRLITAAVCAVCAALGTAVVKIKENKQGDDENEESDSTDTGSDNAA